MSFDASKLPGGNTMFPSTGNVDEDARVATDIRLRAGRLAEGICPNGDGRLVEVSPTERHCDTCRFVHQRFSLGVW